MSSLNGVFAVGILAKWPVFVEVVVEIVRAGVGVDAGGSMASGRWVANLELFMVDWIS